MIFNKIKDLKEEGKMIEAIPYVAVFGIAALAVYGITKMVQSLYGYQSKILVYNNAKLW
jgi:hypothetical protein